MSCEPSAVAAEMSLGFSPNSQNAGIPQGPGTQLQKLQGQTVPGKGWDMGWLEHCAGALRHGRNNLTKSIFVSAKPLGVLGESPTSSRSHKPFIPHHRTARQCPCSCNGTSRIRIARTTVSTNISCNQAQRMFFS